MTYINKNEFMYWSDRYDKGITIPAGYQSDGATGAIDIPDSIAWWVHDRLCDRGSFDDGTECTNWQASTILSDILLAEGRWVRAFTWRWSTFLFGGSKLRKF